MYNFPNCSDIDRRFIDNTKPEDLEDLLAHLQMSFEKVLAPQSSQERMHSLHIESLIRITRANIAALDILDQAQARR